MIQKLTVDHPDIPAVEKLFEEAFPPSERPMTMTQLLARAEEMQGQLSTELLGIYPDEAPDDFSGFFLTVKVPSFVFLLFFATCPEKRSTGIGSKAIHALREYCGATPLVFNYESVYQESDNAKQRERRRSFYLKNGFHETGWFLRGNGTEFIVACSGESFDKEAYEMLMRSMRPTGPNAPEVEMFRRD